MTTSVRLVGQPRLGVVNQKVSFRILDGRVAHDPIVPDFIKRECVSILPDWRPHHPAVPEHAGHAGQEEDWQHLEGDYSGRDSPM